jgi:hypothetical protein
MSLRKVSAIKRISVTETKYGRTIRVPIQLYIKKENGKTSYQEIKGSAIIFDLESPGKVDEAVKIITQALMGIKLQENRNDRPGKVAART